MILTISSAIDILRQCYDGVKMGVQDTAWIVLNPTKRGIKSLRSVWNYNEGDIEGDNGDTKEIIGFKVVGVGFGRTGTYSLSLALDVLGYPTLHTQNFYDSKNQGMIEMWTEKVFRPAIESKQLDMGNPDFDLITSHGYTATVDFPMALYFEEIHERYPDCKFILTTRDNSEVWFKSWNILSTNIAHTTNAGGNILSLVYQFCLYLRWLFGIVNQDPSILSIPVGEPIPNPNKARSIASYEEHNRRVREIIPADMLLEYNVKEGWEPLCRFLEVEDCPTQLPFPKTNSALKLKVQSITAVAILFVVAPLVVFSVFAWVVGLVTGRKVPVWKKFHACVRKLVRITKKDQ